MENFLCDQSFWLDPHLLSDVEIYVKVDEEHLATLYLGLLLQEGNRLINNALLYCIVKFAFLKEIKVFLISFNAKVNMVKNTKTQ